MMTTIIRIFIITGLVLFVAFVLLACLIVSGEADEAERKYWEEMEKQDETHRSD